MKGHQTNRARTFTLIELLVVIAIIAILASMLLPALQQSKAKAKQSTCIGNIKQVSMAVLMYSTDFDERMPRALRDSGGGTWVPADRDIACCGGGGSANWRANRNVSTLGRINDGRLAHLVKEYAGNTLEVFKCPSLTWEITATEVSNGYMGYRNGLFVWQNGYYYDGYPITRLKDPSGTGMLADPVGWIPNGGQQHMRGTPPARIAPYCHTGTSINIAFADGHATNAAVNEFTAVFWRNPL